MLLVGGASRRFGSPKALIELDGETLHDRGRRVLAAACDEVLVVGKAGELPFEVLDDGSDVRAPIAGVVAGLRAAATRGRRVPAGRLSRACTPELAARPRRGLPRRGRPADGPAARRVGEVGAAAARAATRRRARSLCIET